MSLVWTLDPGAAAGRYEAAGGGSQPVRRFPFAYNTAAILTGYAFDTPPVGTWLDAGYPSFICSVTTAFNGTTPKIDLGVMVSGVFVSLTGGSPVPVDVADVALVGSSFKAPANLLSPAGTNAYALYQTGTDPLAIQLSDGASGDPGSTVGAGAIVWLAGGAP